MQITVNGEPREVAEGITIENLVKLLALDAESTVAEHNGEIVPRDNFPSTALAPNDSLELVRFVGGG
jgi:sulfur carrier protein